MNTITQLGSFLVGIFLFTEVSLAQSQPVRAVISLKEENAKKISAEKSVLIYKADITGVYVKNRESDMGKTKYSLSQIHSIRFARPEIFKEAMKLWQNKSYQEAEVKFAQCYETYRFVERLPNNYSTLAGYYRLECLRHLEKFRELKREFDNYKLSVKPSTAEGFPASLDKTFYPQLKLYDTWGVVGTENIRQIFELIEEIDEEELTASTKVQLSYLKALAHEEEGRNKEALYNYYEAFVLNYGASQALTKQALLKAMDLLATPGRDKKELRSLIQIYLAYFGEEELPPRFKSSLPKGKKDQEA